MSEISRKRPLDAPEPRDNAISQGLGTTYDSKRPRVDEQVGGEATGSIYSDDDAEGEEDEDFLRAIMGQQIVKSGCGVEATRKSSTTTTDGQAGAHNAADTEMEDPANVLLPSKVSASPQAVNTASIDPAGESAQSVPSPDPRSGDALLQKTEDSILYFLDHFAERFPVESTPRFEPFEDKDTPGKYGAHLHLRIGERTHIISVPPLYNDSVSPQRYAATFALDLDLDRLSYGSSPSLPKPPVSSGSSTPVVVPPLTTVPPRMSAEHLASELMSRVGPTAALRVDFAIGKAKNAHLATLTIELPAPRRSDGVRSDEGEVGTDDGVKRRWTWSTTYPHSAKALAKDFVIRKAFADGILDVADNWSNPAGKADIPAATGAKVDEAFRAAAELTKLCVENLGRNFTIHYTSASFSSPAAVASTSAEKVTPRQPSQLLIGATLHVLFPKGEMRTFSVEPLYRSKKAAKDAAARAALSAVGLRDEVEAAARDRQLSNRDPKTERHNSQEGEKADSAQEELSQSDRQADALGLTKAKAGPPPIPGSVAFEDFDTLEDPLDYINRCFKMWTKHNAAPMSFQYTNDSGQLRPSVHVKLSPQLMKDYSCEETFPDKKTARVHLARVALKEGLVDLILSAHEAKNGMHVTAAPSPVPPVQQLAAPASAILDIGAKSPNGLYVQKRAPGVRSSSPQLPTNACGTAATGSSFQHGSAPFNAGPNAIQALPIPMADQRLGPLASGPPPQGLSAQSLKHFCQGWMGHQPEFEVRHDQHSNSFGAVVKISIGPDNLRTFMIQSGYPSPYLATEAVTMQAIQANIIGTIRRDFNADDQGPTLLTSGSLSQTHRPQFQSAASLSRPAYDQGAPIVGKASGSAASTPSHARSKVPDKPAAEARNPISVLNEITAVLFKKDPSLRPNYRITPVGRGTCAWTATLKVPLDKNEVLAFSTSTTCRTDKEAKRAVANLALQEGIEAKILQKAQMMTTKRQTAPSLTAAANAEPAASTSTVVPEKTTESTVSKLDDFCRLNNRGTPIWGAEEVPMGSASQPTKTQCRVWLTIGDLKFEFDKERFSAEQAGKERLAERVLKYLRKELEKQKDAAG